MLKSGASLLAAVLLVSACAGTEAATRPPATAAATAGTDAGSAAVSAEAEAYAVYSAVIQALYASEGVEQFVIRDHTISGVSPDDSLDREMEFLQEQVGAAIDPALLDDYRTRNLVPQALEEQFSLALPYTLISEAEFNRLFEQGDGWNRFYASYPGAQGVMTLSQVGFDASGTQALVYTGNQADAKAGQGYYLFLTKETGTWAIQEMVLAWVS